MQRLAPRVVWIAVVVAACEVPATPAPAPSTSTPVEAPAPPPPPPPTDLQLRWVRDSREYWTLSHEIYQDATAVLPKAATPRWAVVTDIDETMLDNSAYQVERAAQKAGWSADSWAAWVDRREAMAVPGSLEFTKAVHAAGGRIAFISDRDNKGHDATLANLIKVGLWADGDRLCTKSGKDDTKRSRRDQVRTGAGDCSWHEPVRVVAYLGDQMADFPEPGEEGAPSEYDPSPFGTVDFLLPNPMYASGGGGWTTSPTRPR